MAYHSEHNSMNRAVAGVGMAGNDDVRDEVDRVRRSLSVEICESQKDTFLRMVDLRLLRKPIAFPSKGNESLDSESADHPAVPADAAIQPLDLWWSVSFIRWVGIECLRGTEL